MLTRFRAPRERAQVGTIDEVVTVLGRLGGRGRHPDLRATSRPADFASIELLGELARRLAPQP